LFWFVLASKATTSFILDKHAFHLTFFAQMLFTLLAFFIKCQAFFIKQS